jgi:membrane-associated phospholipid phosphatase
VTDEVAGPPPQQEGAPHWRVQLFCLLAGTAAFFLSAIPIDERNVSETEVTFFRFLDKLPGAIYWPMWAVMQLGNLVVVPVLALIALGFKRFRLAAALAISGTLVWLVAKVIKRLVERGRPGELVENIILRHAPAAGNGFISGHAAVAFAMAAVLSPYLNRQLQVVAWALAVLVCIARVYVGAHLPLDVIGGAGFGLAVGALVNLLLGGPNGGGLVGSASRATKTTSAA